MSALRFATPSRPRPTLDNGGLIPVDDGASPRIDVARATSSRFTPLTEAQPFFRGMRGVEIRAKATSDSPKRRAMTVVVRCGKPVMGLGRKPTGEPCYRRAGHGEGCRDKATVERDNARRRTQDQGREDLGRARAGGGATDEAARALPPGHLADG